MVLKDKLQCPTDSVPIYEPFMNTKPFSLIRRFVRAIRHRRCIITSTVKCVNTTKKKFDVSVHSQAKPDPHYYLHSHIEQVLTWGGHEVNTYTPHTIICTCTSLSASCDRFRPLCRFPWCYIICTVTKIRQQKNRFKWKDSNVRQIRYVGVKPGRFWGCSADHIAKAASPLQRAPMEMRNTLIPHFFNLSVKILSLSQLPALCL